MAEKWPTVRRADAQMIQLPPPVDKDTRLALVDEERPRLEEVGLYVPWQAQSEIDRFIQLWDARDRMAESGLPVVPTLLLYGPPGCGKTQCARHIAARVELPLFVVRFDSLIQSHMGETAANVRSVFDFVSNQQAVLFIDELDAIAAERTSKDSSASGEMNRTTIALLQNLDKAAQRIVIAATNRESDLDGAIWRRFARKVEIGIPETAARRAMLTEFFHGMASESLIARCAELTDGHTGADIRTAAEESCRDAILDDAESVNQADFVRNLGRCATRGAR